MGFSMIRTSLWGLVFPLSLYALETEAPYLDLMSEGRGIYGVRSINSYSQHPWDRAGSLNTFHEFEAGTLDLGLGQQKLLGAESWRSGSRIVLGNEVGDPLWRETLPGEQINNRTPTMQLMGEIPWSGGSAKIGLEQIDHYQSATQGIHNRYGDQVGIIGDDWSWQGENFSSHSMGFAQLKFAGAAQSLDLSYREGWLWLPHSTDAGEDPLYLRLASGQLLLPKIGLKVLPQIWQENLLGTRTEAYGMQNSILQSLGQWELGLHSWDFQGSTRTLPNWGSKHWLSLGQNWQTQNWAGNFYAWASSDIHAGAESEIHSLSQLSPGLSAKWNRNSPLHALASPYALELRPRLNWQLWQNEEFSLRLGQEGLLAWNQDRGFYGQKFESMDAVLYAQRSTLQSKWQNEYFGLEGHGYYEWRNSAWKDCPELSPPWGAFTRISTELPEDLEIALEGMVQAPAEFRFKDSTWKSRTQWEPSASIRQYWLQRRLQAYAGIINFAAIDQKLHPWGSENRFRIVVKVQYNQ